MFKISHGREGQREAYEKDRPPVLWAPSTQSLTLAQKTKALTSFLIQDNLKIGGGLMCLKFSKKRYYLSSSSLKSD